MFLYIFFIYFPIGDMYIFGIDINMIENFLNNGYTFFEFLDKVRSEFLTDVHSDFNTAYFHELSEKLSYIAHPKSQIFT